MIQHRLTLCGKSQENKRDSAQVDLLLAGVQSFSQQNVRELTSLWLLRLISNTKPVALNTREIIFYQP